VLRFLAPALAIALPARACDIALVLAMDVSGSVDPVEYRLQTEGLAWAMRDPAVTEAMVERRVAVAVTQWSGARDQTLGQGWTRIAQPADVQALAATLSRMPRAFAGSQTGVGAALRHAAGLFAQVPDCTHRVIDISGDGDENDGFTLSFDRRAVIDQGITINALAIEDRGLGQAITNFYRGRVISRDGFVITARGHAEFADAMRRKLLRELSPAMIVGSRPADRQAPPLP
jgi:Ca-activated chloride channel family protein